MNRGIGKDLFPDDTFVIDLSIYTYKFEVRLNNQESGLNKRVARAVAAANDADSEHFSVLGGN